MMLLPINVNDAYLFNKINFPSLSVPSGELLETVVAENSLTEAVAVGYLSQLLSAVDTLHRLKIAHLDIRVSQL